MVIAAKQDLHRDEIAQLLDQYLFTDTTDAPSDFSEAGGPALDMKKNKRLPFASDNSQRHIQTAGCIRPIHANLYLTFW